MSTIRGGTTPICITYRKVSERPSVKRTRTFVGWRQLLKNVVGVVAEFVDSISYEVKEEMEAAGEVAAVHWAIEVDDPWGVNAVNGLVAVRVPERPPAGVHFEIVRLDPSLAKPPEPKPEPAPAPKSAVKPKESFAGMTPGQVEMSRPRGSKEQAEIRERMRAALQQGGHFDYEAGMPPP